MAARATQVCTSGHATLGDELQSKFPLGDTCSFKLESSSNISLADSSKLDTTRS